MSQPHPIGSGNAEGGDVEAERLGPSRPLSPGQLAIWYLRATHAADTDAFLVPLLYEVEGPLNVNSLRQAFDTLRLAHPALTMQVTLDEGGPVASLGDRSGHDVEVRDWSTVEDARSRVLLPLDLSGGQSSRMIVWQRDAARFVVGFTFDHMVFDGWSEELLWRDLARFYNAATSGDVEDYVVNLSLPEFSTSKEDEQFWFDRLKEVSPFSVPGDLSSEVRTSIRSDAYVLDELGARPSLALRDLASKLGTSQFVVLLSGFAALLARYVDREDVTVAVPFTLRGRSELQQVIGNFLNTIAIHVDVVDSEAFDRLVARVSDGVLDAMEHGEYPFADVVKTTAQDRDGAGNPVTSVMFNVQHANGDTGFSLRDCRAKEISVYNPGSSYDLNLQVSEGPGGAFRLYLEYASSRWSQAAARSLLGNFVRLIEQVCSTPDTPVGRVTVGNAEVSTNPDWESAPPVRADLPTLLSRVALSNPKKIALREGSLEVPYSDLQTRIDLYARALAGRVPTQATICLFLENSVDLVALIVACLKTRITYVPMNVNEPPLRVASVIAKVRPHLVLVTEALENRLKDTLVGHEAADRVVTTSRLQPSEPALPEFVEAQQGQTAYIIFTSGTTGEPKGVMCTYEGLENYVDWATRTYGGTRPGSTALVSPLCFDLAIPNLLVGLVQGRTVNMLRQPLDVASFADDLVEGGPYAFLKVAPGHLELLSADLSTEQISSLSAMVISAGDKFNARLANHWLDVEGVEVASEYGPTEITIGNSAELVREPLDAGLVPLGSPIPGTTMYVLDRALRKVPPGGEGEVYVGGRGVAVGYLGNARLTAERFLPDPWGSESGARMYRTGDVVRITATGQVLFEGRRDGQLKIGAHRVEIDEIAGVVAEFPDVKHAFVDAHVVLEGVIQLSAYVVPVGDLDTANLKSFVEARIPAYMVPTAFHAVDRLPTTSNGKIDQAALRRLGALGRQEKSAGVPRSSDPTERAIAEVWERVLGVEGIDPTASFFELGGDSIRAVTIVGRLKADGYTVTVQDIFRHRTVRALSAAISPTIELSPVPYELVAPFSLLTEEDRLRLPGDLDDAYPVSAVQLGMLVELLDSGGFNYFNVTSYRIDQSEPVDLDRFRAAVASVVAEEDILRTSFAIEGFSVPLQFVHTDAVMEVTFMDLRGLTAGEGDAALRESMERARSRKFKLNDYPLFRFRLLQFDDHWRLNFSEFHPILEGWSLHVMLMRILNRYRGRVVQGGPTTTILTSGRPRFADFIALESVESRAPEVLDFWVDELTDAEPFRAPPGARSTNLDFAVTVVNYADLTAGLHRRAAQCDVPMKTVIHAAHLLVLLKIAPQRPGAGRRRYSGLVCDTRPEVEGFESVLGLYLNTVPFVVPEFHDVEQFLRDVFAQEVRIWPHRRVAVGRLAQKRGRRLHMPTEFAYLNFHLVDEALINLDAGLDESPDEFELGVTSQGDSEIYVHGRLSPDFRSRLEREYRWALEALADEAADAEFLKLAGLGSAGPRSSSSVPPIATSAEVWARLRAVWLADRDRPAILLEGDHLTGAELLEAVENLARQLVERRAQTAAVLLPRGAALVVAHLATVVSGACLVLVEPDLPPDRIRAQLELTQPDVLLVPAEPDDNQEVLGTWPELKLGRRGDVPRHGESENREAASTWDVRTERAGYIVFTSGTTGEPKAVVNSLRGLTSQVAHMMAHLPLTSDDRALYKSPVTFDVCLNELLWPLLSGAALVVARHQGHLDATYLTDLIRRQSVTYAEFVPTVLDVMLQLHAGRDTLPTLRVAISSGEALNSTLARRFAERVPDSMLLNAYGPAETAITATYSVIEPEHAVDIGHPLDGVDLTIVDSRGDAVPDGTPGEITIGGNGVGYGYVGLPALTAEKFRPDPAGPPGSRRYSTGDTGRINPDGSVAFLGRVDRQVKINGVRIEPEEVERVIETAPGVSRAVVTTQSKANQSAGSHLVAFVVASEGAAPVADTLRHAVRGVLPATHVPTRFEFVESIPFTSNGKVDFDTLSAQLPDRGSGTSPNVRVNDEPPGRAALSNEDGRVTFIKFAWREVLSCGEVDLEDNFFDLGGQSIDAMYVAALLSKQFGVKVWVADILAAPTVGDQLDLVVSKRLNGMSNPLITLDQGPSERTVLLAPPVGGNAVSYRPLSARLSESGYRVVASGWPPVLDVRDVSSLRAMAEVHVTSWLSAGMTRPWNIGGWSFGGALAYEMCACLVERGEYVDQLVLLDAAYAMDEPPLLDQHELEELFVEMQRIDGVASIHVSADDDVYRAERTLFAENVRLLGQWKPSHIDPTKIRNVVAVQSRDDRETRRRFWSGLLTERYAPACIDVGHFALVRDDDVFDVVAKKMTLPRG